MGLGHTMGEHIRPRTMRSYGTGGGTLMITRRWKDTTLKEEKNGTWTWWFDNGVKQSEGNYYNDEQNGLWSYFALDGSIAEEITFTAGKRDGRSTIWLNQKRNKKKNFTKTGNLTGQVRIGLMGIGVL